MKDYIYIGIIAALFLVFFMLHIIQSSRISKLMKRYEAFMEGKDATNLADAIEENFQQMEKLESAEYTDEVRTGDVESHRHEVRHIPSALLAQQAREEVVDRGDDQLKDGLPPGDVVHLEVPGEQDGDDDQKQHDAPADHHGFRHLQAAEGDHLHIQLFFQGRSQCVHRFASFLSRVLSWSVKVSFVFTLSPFVSFIKAAALKIKEGAFVFMETHPLSALSAALLRLVS